MADIESQRWEVHDRYGNRIYMTAERRQHVLARRPWLEEHFDDLLETLRKGRSMSDRLDEHYEYDEESDMLDVYFGVKRPAWTIELTANIILSVDRERRKALALGFLDFCELARRTPFGPRSFPITGLADMPLAERDLVLEILNAEPVNRWLDVSCVQMLPDSPFAVAHLERVPKDLARLALAAV